MSNCLKEYLGFTIFDSSLCDPLKHRMAPKSSKGKRPAASTSSFDANRFQNAESAEHFESEFKDRTVIFERIVVPTDFALRSFLTWIHLNRLMILMSLTNKCFEN